MKYSIITFGCQMNKSDSERIASILEKMSLKETTKINEADFIVVNMCSVRQSAVDRVYGLAPKFRELKKQKPNLKTILTGCILKEDKKKFQKFFDLILDIKNLKKWPKLIKEKRSDIFLNTISSNYFKIPPKYQTKPLAFVPISFGCNNACSYCVVPLTRGRLVLRSPQEILKEVKNLLKSGFKEIWLLGQNVNDYRFKIKKSGKKIKIVDFSDLLKMIEKIEGNFKFFFTSPHPKNFSDKLIKTLAKSKKFGKYLNLPLQSGDNEILKKMKRDYTVQEYKKLFKKIKKSIPDIKISTDIIVGFPGETKKQFENTKKILKELKFDNAYIAKYSSRQGTFASTLKDDIPFKEKKRREKILREIVKKYAKK